MRNYLLSFFITISLPYTLLAMYGPRPGLMQRLEMHNQKETIKDQRTELAKLEDDIKEFQDWLTREGILFSFNEIKDDYMTNVNVENQYISYIKSTNKKMIKAPAGYRLPEFRYYFTPLSEVLKKYSKIIDILDEDKQVTSLLAPRALIEERRISELRDHIADYRRDLQTNTITPDQQARINTASATVDSLTAQISAVEQGIKTYLSVMGISESALKKDPNDMADMAKEIEELIAEINKNEVALAIEALIVKRYNGIPNINNNPYTFPLNDPNKTTYGGLKPDEIEEKIAQYQQKMFHYDKVIREKALDPNKKFFAANATPPPFNQMMNSTLVHEYMYDGYLGYWLQNIINKMHELKLAGFDIIQARLTEEKLINDLKSTYIEPLTIFASNAFKSLPIMIDYTAPQIDAGALQKELAMLETDQFLKTFNNKWQETNTKLKAAYDKIINASPEEAQVFTLRTSKTSGIPAVPETFLLRRTVMLINYFASAIKNTPFTPATYTSDFMGPVPSGLWPEIVTTA